MRVRRSARSRSVPTPRVSTAAVAPRTASTCSRCARSRSARASTASSRSSSAATTRRPTAAGQDRREPAAHPRAPSRQRRLPRRLRQVRDMARQLVRHGHITVNGQQGRHPVASASARTTSSRSAQQLARADAVRRRARRGRRAHGAGVARGHPRPDARPGPLAPGPRSHRHPGPGAADRRALLASRRSHRDDRAASRGTRHHLSPAAMPSTEAHERGVI